MRIHLITAESPASRRLRFGRLIQFPQLTMPLIAALTPPEHEVSHTDEVVERVRFDAPADLVGITAPTPSALHGDLVESPSQPGLHARGSLDAGRRYRCAQQTVARS